MIDFLKRYWFLIAVIGFLITFSSQIQAMYKTPEEVKNLSQTVTEYVASEAEAGKQRDKLLQMLIEDRLRRSP